MWSVILAALKNLKVLAAIAFLVLIAVILWQRATIARLESVGATLAFPRDAALADAARNLKTANENAANSKRVLTDFNASLTACYKDYKSLADSFDFYRQTVAQENAAHPVILSAPSVILSEAKNLKNRNLAKNRDSSVATLLQNDIQCRILPPSAAIDALNSITSRGSQAPASTKGEPLETPKLRSRQAAAISPPSKAGRFLSDSGGGK